MGKSEKLVIKGEVPAIKQTQPPRVRRAKHLAPCVCQPVPPHAFPWDKFSKFCFFLNGL